MTILIPCLSFLSSVVSPNERVLQKAALSFKINCVCSDHDDRKLRLCVGHTCVCTYISRGTISWLGGRDWFLRNTPMKALIKSQMKPR